ncbi:hypothetical protein EUTSA_v10022419mg [Eutrema salsugineum]|uniref:DUF1985 domain-containing protein n=1 Tax=Eutrema salsugineum TaxID=72664 RepID=V4M5L8_EUTSA|nr:hypothetical protein EUTSA_v10022419mg [Eutrema salsugineum]
MTRFPDRLFALGNEPANKKVNTYFQLPYLDTISHALEEEHMEKLSLSQFGKIIETSNKIASSVRFLHFILSRQLVTKKKKELWCLFAGQPIRFSIREFAITTGLDCSNLPPPKKFKEDQVNKYTVELFGSERNATPGWIANTLAGRPYKDKATRFKLACLLLIDRIVCPTSKNAKISAKHIMLVQDVDKFLEYPWGRKSFDLTIHSIKTRTATTSYLSQPTCAFQGFLHALQMVVLECAPSILQKDSIHLSSGLRLPTARKSYVAVTAILPDDEHLLDDTDFAFDDDVPDETVDNLLAAISDGKKFSRKTWNGGESASLLQNQPNAPASSSRNTSSDVDLDSAASSMLEKVVRETGFVLSEIKSLRTEFVDLRSKVSSTLSTFKDYIRSQQDLSPKVREPAKRPLGRRVKSIPLRAKHVRFQQVSSSEESKSSDPSKEDDGDDGTKNKDSSSPSTESDDVVDTNVGDVVEIYDGDAHEDRREPDAEGSGDVGEVGKQMPVDVDDVQDAATLASNQIASVLSDLSDQVNVEPSIIQPVPSPPPYVVQPRDQTGADKVVPPVVTNEETDAAEDVQPVVTNDGTDAAKEVSPVDMNNQTSPQEDVTPVQTNDQTVPQKEVPPEPQVR